MSQTRKSRPSPEELLKRVEAEKIYHQRGRLKVFLGYAAGVGKSFRMFDEGRRRKARGQDVVVAAIQPSAQVNMEELLGGFEYIPSLTGGGGPAIDVAAVKRRAPAVCLIDGLAYRNPAGSKHRERWQDVEELLESGLSVLTTINLQYIREKQAAVEAIRGKTVADSVPESFLRQADEIEIVDAPPGYCLGRADTGELPIDPQALQRHLSELREIALVLAAEVVDSQLDSYLQRHGITQTHGMQERILVCMTPRSNAELMIGLGRRQADRFHGELFAAYVQQRELSSGDQSTLQQNLDSARFAKAHIVLLQGDDLVTALLQFAAKECITQIFVGHSQRRGLWQRLRSNPVERLILESSGIDIRIFPQKKAGRVT